MSTSQSGTVGAVLLQRGAPPQAARVGRVAPEVVQVLAAAADVGDAAVGVEHLEGFGAHLLEAVVAQFGQRRLVVGAHPVQGVVSGDILEPNVRVINCLFGHVAIVAVPVVWRTWWSHLAF